LIVGEALTSSAMSFHVFEYRPEDRSESASFFCTPPVSRILTLTASSV